MLYLNFHENTFVFAPYAFLSNQRSSSSSFLTPMQGPGWYVLSKTRHTTQETAGIPIWSPSDSCSACAVSAQRCFRHTYCLLSKHLKEYYNEFLNCQRSSVLMEPICSLQKGHVKCNTIKCPALSCETPVAEPQQCCPRCTGRPSTSKRLNGSEAFESDDFPGDFLSSSGDQVRIPAGLRASVRSCRYNGTVYQPGETFNKHDFFPSKQSNQCVICTCSVSYLLFSLYDINSTQGLQFQVHQILQKKLQKKNCLLRQFFFIIFTTTTELKG